MDIPHVIAWSLFLAFVLVMLAVDLFVLHRKPHEIRFREALIGSLIPVTAALLFLGIIYFAYEYHYFNLGIVPADLPSQERRLFPTSGGEAAILFLTGYVVELSLSADNVFLFVVLMGFFAVPLHLQHRVLFWGVLGALVMRAAMILAGAALLSRFSWIIYIFGAFLIFTGIKMLFSGEEEPDPSNSLPVRLAKKVIPVHPGYVDQKFFTRINGRLYATTLFLVLVAIEFTDLVFALDSIPAIFGITKDPFIVFTSNVFAILGLRSMYFLLAGVIDKFHYLKFGLSFVLAFVGVKMLLPLAGELYTRFIDPLHTHEWHLDKFLSLGIIVTILAASVILSLVFPKKHPSPHPPLEDIPETENT